MDRFRVLSDLHMDINAKYPFSIEDTDVFTVVAGDTAGEPYLISCKMDNPYVGMKVEDSGKAVKFIGEGRANAVFIYDGNDKKWKYGNRDVTFEDSGIEITENGIWTEDGKTESKTNDGDRIVVKVNNSERWLRRNVKNGIIVAGNHLVYNNFGLTIEDLKKNLSKKFPINGKLSFLDNSVGIMEKEVDGILFVGSTLYTDYRLPVDGERIIGESRIIEFNKRMASPKMSGGGLNDFNFGFTEEATYDMDRYFNPEHARLTPTNYERFFERTFSELQRIVEKKENLEKDIVVVTHHCPSPKCISSEYVDSPMNASYVSNLEDFIISHENIKCWVCGHVHHRANFMVGKCRVVMNPLGYCKYGEFLSSKDGISGDWSPNTYVNTKTWEVEIEPYDLTKFKAQRNKDENARMAWLKKYGGMFF